MKRVVGFLLFLALWELVGQQRQMQFVLPPPSLVAIGLWEHADRFWLHSAATLREMLGGLIIAIAVALPLAALMVVRRGTGRWVSSVLVVLQCIPMVALAPLMVIWFGWTYTAVLIPTVLMIFFPLALTFYAGFGGVPDAYLALFRRWGATEYQLLWHLRLPWALPQVAHGVRIAAGMAGIGAIVGEWAGAQQGLGVLMLESRRAADVVTLFGAIVCLVLLTLTLTLATLLLQRLAAAQRPLKILWRTNKHRKQILSCAGIVALLSALSFSAVPVTQPQNGEMRLVLDWFPNPNHIPLFAGIERGIFHKHRVPVQISKVQDPGDVIPYLTSGQADIAVTYMPSLVMHGADVRVMGYLVKEPLVALIAREGLDLSSPCVIGCATDGIQTPLLRTLLNRNASPDAQMMSVSFDLVSAFLSGQVDAIFGGYWNIETEHIRSQGQESDYLTLSELGVPHHFELVLVGQPIAREMIGRFKRALQESIDWCREHPEEAFKLYASSNPDKTPTSLAWERRAWQRTLPTFAHNQSDEQDVWHNYASWLQDNHLLPTSVSLDHLFLD